MTTEELKDIKEKEAKWYVVHTYSGHENKVKANIEKLVVNRGNDIDIFEVVVPTVKEETETGKIKERQLFPGYVLVKMIITDISWYLVRNTRGVTGFVGSGNKPVPLSEKEVEALGVSAKPYNDVDIYEGDSITIIDGAFKDLTAKVIEVSQENGKLKAFVSLFGRDTLAELDFSDVIKN